MLSTKQSLHQQILRLADQYVNEVLGKSQNFEIASEEKKNEQIEMLQQSLLFIIEAIEDDAFCMKTVSTFAHRYADQYIIYFHDAETIIRDCSELKNMFRNQVVYPYYRGIKQERALSIVSVFMDEFMIRLFKEKQWEMERMEVEKFDAIGNMASGMAHELRNPLTSIKGFLKLIYEMHPHPQEIHQYYSIIEDEVKRLDYILERFLSLSKRKSLPMKREFEEVSLHHVIEKCMALFEFEFIRLGIETTVVTVPEARIRGNYKELEQTFINIIKNACEEFQSIPHQKVKRLDISCRVTENRVYILFFNNGKPIEQEAIKKIFSPFFSTKQNGTGLGLAICKQIIAAHGGEILIYPEADGTMVEVKLPRQL